MTKKEEKYPEGYYPPGYKPINYEGDSFMEVLANATNSQKRELVQKLLLSIQLNKGDPAAWRIIEKALIETKPKDEKNRPIPILGGITQTINEQGNKNDEGTTDKPLLQTK